MIYLDTALSSLVYLAACFILFYLGKLLYGVFHRQVNAKHELVEKDNFAFAVAHVGYFIGLVLAITGALIGPSEGLLPDLIDIGIYGLLAILLLNLSVIVNDKLLFPRFSVYREITEDRNVGVGAIEGANSIATGLIILGAVSGEGGGVLTALVFWLVGQLLLLLTAFVYRALVPYDVHDQIERDNVAVGLAFAGALVSIANLIRFGLMGDFYSWTESLTNVGRRRGHRGCYFCPSCAGSLIRFCYPAASSPDELVNQETPNVGAGLIEAFAYVGGSVLITLCL